MVADLSFPTADRLAVGVLRYLGDLGFRGLAEFRLSTGRRVDVIGLDRKGKIVIIEIKRSRQDFVTDCKWPEYLDYCDFFYFAVPLGLDSDWLPPAHGLIRADPYGAQVIRPAASRARPLHASRRREVTLRFARTAAARLLVLNMAASDKTPPETGGQ